MSTAQKTTGNPAVVLFIGQPRHGKTTARKILSEMIGQPGASCSDVIYPLLAKHLKMTEAELRAMEKEETRPMLVEFGDYLCGKTQHLSVVPGGTPGPGVYFRSPSTLFRSLYLMGIRIIDGVRRKEELDEIRQILHWLNVPLVVFWVERPGNPPTGDNTAVTSKDADAVLLNDGTPTQLKEKLQTWLDPLKRD
jgi:hypothetical protein